MLEAVGRGISRVTLAAAWNEAAVAFIVVAVLVFLAWVLDSDKRTRRLKGLLRAAARRAP